MPQLKLFALGSAALVLLSACGQYKSIRTDDVNTIVNLEGRRKALGRATSSVRVSALKDIGSSVSARAALAKRTKAINKTLERQARKLDQAFDFSPLLIDHRIVPPVLEEGRHELSHNLPDMLRLADRTYRVVRQARFVTTPPNWRDYLLMDHQDPETPNADLLPRTTDERKVWRDSVKEGYELGLKQADVIFADKLARLKRDYKGMVLYRKLLAQKMVSAPFVAKTNLGVTGNANELHINDKVLRIVALPELQTNPELWQTGVSR